LVRLNKLATSEDSCTSLKTDINSREDALKKRVIDCDMRERELLSRRKELESWDVLLREKDRKVVQEQILIDEREDRIRLLEEKIRSKELELEKRQSVKGC
jgi:uncharacterized protein (DUF3084 family)